MKIREVKQEEIDIIRAVVDVHLRTFQGFFLSFMGRGFLRQMYQAYCEHEASGLFVALDEEKTVVGFLAYSESMSALYKYMIRRRLVGFAWYSIGAFFRKPKIFLRLLRAFLKPAESRREEQYVELASIGVAPAAKTQGIGTQLITCLKEKVDFSKYAYIALETDAINNDAANRFYVKNGFSLVRTYETREGRKMNEYRYGESE